MATQGYQDYYIGLVDEVGNCHAASLILTRKFFGRYKYAYAPRGFLLDYRNKELVETFLTLLKPTMKKLKVAYIRIDPPVLYKPVNAYANDIYNNLKELGFTHRGFNQFFENLIPRTIMVTSLDNPQEDLFRHFNKETKNKIRKANRNGLSILKGTKDDIELIYNFGKAPYVKPLNYYQQMYDLLNPKNMMDVYLVKLIPNIYLQNNRSLYEEEYKYNQKLTTMLYKKARNHKIVNKKMASDKRLNIYKQEITLATNLMAQYPNGLIIGGSIVCAYKKELLFLLEGFNPNLKRFCPNHLSKWAIMRTYSNIGINRFNLNAISSDLSKENQFYGLYTFKKGFKSHVEEYLGEFEYITNKFAIFLYKIKLKLKKWF